MTSRTRFLVGLLAVVVIALAATGGVLLSRAHHLRDASAASNQALVDPGATKQVEDQVSSGLTKILTFDHNDPDTTQKAAADVLAGKAKTQYDELFKTLLAQSGSQQLTLTSKVVKVGVLELSDSSAQLLVFVDQSSTRAADGQSNVAAAQLTVDAVKRDGRWLISELNPL